MPSSIHFSIIKDDYKEKIVFDTVYIYIFNTRIKPQLLDPILDQKACIK